MKATCPLHPRTPWATGRPLPANWTALRTAVVRRDGALCQRCGTTQDLQLDHVVERADGGSDELANLRLLCKAHHKEKTDQAARDRRARRKGNRG